LIGLPAYQRIEEDIRAQIRAGRWPLGASLPSRRDMAKLYGVQLPTLQRAIASLLADGTLTATARQGTIVARADTAGIVELNASDSEGKSVGGGAHATVGIIALVSFDEYSRSDGGNYNGPLVDAIEAQLAAAEIASAFFSRAKYPDQDAVCIDIAMAHGVDALIIVLTHDSTEVINTAIDAVEKLTIPVVFVTADPINAPYSTVCFDQVSAGYRAAQHLIRTDAERIVYLAPYTARWLDERIEGARNAVARTGFPSTAFAVFPDHSDLDPWKSDHIQLSAEAARELAESGRLVGTSIIASNDAGAVALIKVAREYGLAAGIDYQLVSFDDTSSAREYGVSSVRPPSLAMGDEAAKLVIRHLRGENAGLQVSLQSHLVVRSSSRPLIRTIASSLSASLV
jgi:DNA-binding LacI/PurR family transcriptional regulator